MRAPRQGHPPPVTAEESGRALLNRVGPSHDRARNANFEIDAGESKRRARKKPLTATMIKALRLIDEHRPERAKEFGRLMWPDNEGWKRHGKSGHGQSRGVGLCLAAGGYLGKLRKRGLVQYVLRGVYTDGDYCLTDAGRMALREADQTFEWPRKASREPYSQAHDRR